MNRHAVTRIVLVVILAALALVLVRLHKATGAQTFVQTPERPAYASLAG
jgi:hypothetical protein